MRFWTLISVVGLMIAGCAQKEPQKIQACEGSQVKGCSPVIYFLPDSYEISPFGKERLDWSAQKMERWPKKKALITAHAYEWGGAEYNKDLSLQRAKAIGLYFVQKGIEPDRVQINAMGDTEPVCVKQECQNLNRRAVVEIYDP